MNRILLLIAIVYHVVLPMKLKAQEQAYLHHVGQADSLFSSTLDETREIYVHVPMSYDPERKEKYPVVYVLDGDVMLPAVETVHSFYYGGFMPEMVIVGIANNKHRVRDLTTSKITEHYGMPYQQENGEAAKFHRFIESELIPYVEAHYPVSNYRSLIGHSYAGLFSIYSLVNHPETFHNYIAIDPSLDWDNQQLLKEAEQAFSTKSYKGKSLFVSLGGQLHKQDRTITIDNVREDRSDVTLFARSNLAFADMIEANTSHGLDFHWKFYPNDLHGTIPLPSIMDGLIAVFEWYQMEDTDKINDFETSKETLEGIIQHRATKLARHFGYDVPPYPEDLLNVSGYMNMDMQLWDKAKMYFEYAIQYYPKSPNTYDSMADYYERKGAIKKAISYVKKAIAISDAQYFKDHLSALQKK